MRWSPCWWSALAPRAGFRPHETVHRFHFRAVGMVRHAVEQMDDPFGIQIQVGRLLPEPLAAGLIRPHKLGLHKLAGELEQQLAPLQGRPTPARRLAPGCPPPLPRRATGAGGANGGRRDRSADGVAHRWVQRLVQRLVHRSSSRGSRDFSHSRGRRMPHHPLAMKRIVRYVPAATSATVSISVSTAAPAATAFPQPRRGSARPSSARRNLPW